MGLFPRRCRSVPPRHRSQRPGAGASQLRRTGCHYDSDGDLSRYEQTDGSGQLVSAATYGRDALGRTTQSSLRYGRLGGGAPLSFTLGQGYTADNQLIEYPRTINPQLPGSATEQTQVSHTAQGHTESENGASWQRNYRYNAAGRLIEITQTASGMTLSVRYRYDPFGRRIAKTVTEGQSSQTTYYLNGDSALLAEADDEGQITRAYGFNPATQDAEDELWSTDPIWQADVQGGSLANAQTRYHYITTDHLGTPTLATDKRGNKTWRGYSQAFGHTDLEADNSTRINLRFPGQYFDRETGLHQNYFRDYSPARGRYIQSDPLGIFGGLNTYEYASSDPLGYIDPTGEAPVAPIIWGYVRCVASCSAQTAAIEGLTGDISCFDPMGTAKDCALSCANPLNWFKGQVFLKGRNKGTKPQNPNKRPPPPHRQQSGDRERNVKHPDAEEHSRRPKGGFRKR